MEGQQALTRGQVAVMAGIAGATVANIYTNQPILPAIAAHFHATPGEVGRLPVLVQSGYGLGLFFVAPLGDRLDRRTLIVVLELLLAAALVGTAASRGLPALYLSSVLTGVVAVTPQVLLPMAAALAAPERRGRAVGAVFSGSLIGILLSRTVSGAVAQRLNWHWVYALSAVLVLLSAGIAATLLPRSPASHAGGYGFLLLSTLRQFARFPELRRAALLGGLMFGAFCSFWTTLTFRLSAPPFGYGTGAIGMFGFVAVAGALIAPLFGRLSDGRRLERALVAAVATAFVGMMSITLFPRSLTAFVLATVLVDVGVQAAQVGNMARIYALDERAHSRINTIYMTLVFLGGALGTSAGVAAWSFGGWRWVSWQLLAWTGAGLLVATS